MTDDAQARAAVERASERPCSMDVLVNGAVIFNRKGVLDVPPQEWSRPIGVILTEPFLCTKYVTRLRTGSAHRRWYRLP